MRAERAALCLAVGGAKLGGALVHARHGPVRDAWRESLRAARPPTTPWRKIPSHCSIEQLQGGIDLAATLRNGEPVRTKGLLVAAHGGFVELTSAERSEAHLAAALAQMLDASGVTLLAMAEHEADEPGVPLSISDRLAFWLELDDLPYLAIEPFGFDAETLQGLADEVAKVTVDDKLIEAIAATSLAFGVGSMRASIWTLRTACILAAYDGLETPDQAVLAEACGLVLVPRATQMPAPPEEDEPEPEPPEPEQEEEQKPPDQSQEQDNEGLDDKLIEAVRADIPADLLASLTAAGNQRQAGMTGAAGQWRKPAKRGRAIGLKRGDLRSDARIDLVASLTAAAPWQNWRRQQAGLTKAETPIMLEQGDLRFKKFKERRGTLMIFAVDASGSAALNRLGEAKGAVETILAQCYVRRDEAALIAFRRDKAELLLPPTRSLTRAKRLLAGLPGGGATPLAAALRDAVQLSEQTLRKGQSPFVIVLSDGRGNIDLKGEPDRPQALADANFWATRLAALGVSSIVIDTSSRRQQARMTPGPELANTMGARYMVMPMADSQALAATITREVEHG